MKRKIEKPLLKSLIMMASMIEARDAYTGGHLWRVSQYCRQLAEAYGFPLDMVYLCGLGGFLHDIGKVGIPDVILGKRGRLTDSEYEVVKIHPGIGATLVQEHPLGDLALHAIHQHHEWFNGAGYPSRLKGDEISIIARIVSIADAFDALTSTRPYRLGVDANPAVENLNNGRGTQFDALLLDAFIQMVQLDSLRGVVGHSEIGIPMVQCPFCGPVITVDRKTKEGDVAFCRACGSKHRLHRDGDSFTVEPTGKLGSAQELKPCPETNSIEAFIALAPEHVDI
jgi:HD superfamily phosphohydrolase YqeK